MYRQHPFAGSTNHVVCVLSFKVSVILINYNSSEYTKACIESITTHASSNIKYEIIVVDNNSEPEDFYKLQELEFDDKIKLVRSKINLGFAGGNMYGVQFTKAEYYFFLNNDCELQNDCLSILHSFCESNRQVGICSPQMYGYCV